MALSDLNAQVVPWSTNPLLNGKSQAPSFLRTQWDEAKAHAFGPWRLADRSEPTDALTLPAPLNASEFTENKQTPPQEAKDTAALTALGPENTPISQSALAKMLDESFQRGIQEGLQISGQAIQGLIQSCIQQLDHPAQPVKVSLNPQDMKRLQAMGEAVTTHLELEADPKLRPGSVRVRVQDSLVQDLIEHRLESLARRLLPQPEAWMQTSSLVQDKVDAMPENTPKRDWDRQVIDVQDTDAKSTGAKAPDGDMPA